MFKKTFVFFASLFLIFSMSVSANASSDNTIDSLSNKKDLVALGDSITSGYGLFDMLPSPKNDRVLNQRLVSKEAYPQLVGDALGYRVNNLAVSGFTSSELLQLVSNHSHYRTAIKNADLIILNIGGNDLLGYLINVDFSELNLIELIEALELRLMTYYFNLGFILSEIRQLNPTAPILHYGFYNPLYMGHAISEALGDEFLYFYGFLNQITLGINDTVLNGVMYDEFGDQKWNPVSGFLSYAEYFDDLFYVDAFLAFEMYAADENKANLFVDEVHPSIIGHQVLADITIQVLFTEVFIQ